MPDVVRQFYEYQLAVTVIYGLPALTALILLYGLFRWLYDNYYDT
jgi:hypothetical protein